MKGRIAIFIICVCLLITANTARPSAAEEYVSEDWQISVTPYPWGLSAEGDVTVKGNKAEVDLSFSDILNDLNMAAMFEAEACKKRVGLYINAFYAQLEDNTNLLDITLNTTVIGFGGYYRLGPWSLDAEAGTSGPVLASERTNCPGNCLVFQLTVL